MKRGDKVWVCQAGKWSRRVEGIVVATARGRHVFVEFMPPSASVPVVLKARKKKKLQPFSSPFGGYLEKTRDPDNWFTVWPLRRIQYVDSQRYKIVVSEMEFVDFKKRGSNGKHKFKNLS